jgi:hypothetical protein
MRMNPFSTGVDRGVFRLAKDIALLPKLKHRGILKVRSIFTFAAAAYHLVRLRKLVPIQSAA